MIKHIVFFRITDCDDPARRKSLIQELKTRIEALAGKIDEIAGLEAGINLSKRVVAYDLALISDFKTEEDLAAYQAHPEHQKLVDFLNTFKKELAVVDYKY